MPIYKAQEIPRSEDKRSVGESLVAAAEASSASAAAVCRCSGIRDLEKHNMQISDHDTMSIKC